MKRRICSATLALAGAFLVSGCDFDRGIFAAPKKEYLLDFCGTELLIPKSYFVGPKDSEGLPPLELLAASWPEMTGMRMASGHGRSYIRILVGGGDCKKPYHETIEFIFDGYKDGDLPIGQIRPPAKKMEDFEGFQHFVSAAY